ncbi:hypothetical protein APHAL10511_004484 [Amanita phalloides]|nr:hypothetical protein APHAL10511_004484 [Amanita phalloides]
MNQEQDPLSDSDWLDIASSRESDDSDPDDVQSRPLSRRSSISLGSSRDGDVEAWEGFVVDDSAANTPPLLEPDPTHDSNPDQDPAEDERVKEGLEQSLISTLSASRSSSAHTASTHASLHDLRLSFPDPLTSSKDISLSRPGTPSADELDFETTRAAVNDEPSDVTIVVPEQEQGISVPATIQFSKHDVDIDIILYGSSPTSKWSLIDGLLRKAASYSHRTLIRNTPSAGAGYFLFQPQSGAVQLNKVAVYDCTEGASIYSTSSNSDRPSLAVVFLPSSALRALPEHTFYLPIIVDSDAADTADEADIRNNAERTWTSFVVPISRTLRLGHRSILSSSDIREVDSYRAHRALQRPFLYNKKQTIKTLSDHLSSVHAVTFFAFVSIIMSFAINTIFRPLEPTPTSITTVQFTSNGWSQANEQLNSSVASTTAPSHHSTALITSSLKDFALAVVSPASTSLSITSQVSLFVASPPACSGAVSRVKTQPLVAPTNVGLAPSTLSDVPPVQDAIPVIVTQKERDVFDTVDLSIRMIDSISEVFETTFKAAIDAVQNDLKELFDAMNDLMRAIQEQTRKAMETSVEAAHVIREEVRYRNERARGKAREIKEKSEQLVQIAGEQLMETTWSMKMRGEKLMMVAHGHLKDRTALAKEKAHIFRKRVVAHEEWIRKMLDGNTARREYKKWMRGRAQA